MHETKQSSLQKFPTDFCQAQLAEQKIDDPEAVSSNPTGAIFDEIYFVLCNVRSVSESDRNASDFLKKIGDHKSGQGWTSAREEKTPLQWSFQDDIVEINAVRESSGDP